MGIDWMTAGELAQAIPPAYTEFIGAALLEHLLTRSLRKPPRARPGSLMLANPHVCSEGCRP